MDIKLKKFTNWSQTHQQISKIYQPNNLKDLTKFIQYINKKKIKIITKGSAQSYNDQIFVKDGIVLDFKNLNKILYTNYKKKEICVQGGCKIGNIIKKLNQKNYTLGAIPGSEHVTIGGAIINNVHGKDSKSFGTFYNNIIELVVMMTDGKKVSIKKKEIPKILNFGLFYIILEAKLKIIKTQSQFICTKKIYFQNLDEMKKLFLSQNYQFIYGWLDFYSYNNSGYLEVGNYYKGKMYPKKIVLKEILLFFFNHTTFFSKYFLNRWIVSIVNKIIIYTAKKSRSNIISLYNYYYPLKNINLNKIFNEGVMELQILIEEKNFNDIFKKLKIIMNKYNIPSYFMGIKFQKKDNFKLSFNRYGYSFSIVFSKKVTHNPQYNLFIKELKKLIFKKEIFLNLTKDFSINNMEYIKKNKKNFLYYKRKYDKKNILYSDFAKRHNLT